MFKALPVIFRGVSAYLYRPRFRFYIASHRYAPRGTPARHARFSLTISAQLIFAKLHPRARRVRFTRARAPSLLSSIAGWNYVVYWYAREMKHCVFAQRGDRDFAPS